MAGWAKMKTHLYAAYNCVTSKVSTVADCKLESGELSIMEMYAERKPEKQYLLWTK